MHFIVLMLLFMPLMIARLAKLGVLVMLGMGVYKFEVGNEFE